MAQSTRTASGSGGGGSGSDGAPALSTTTTASTLRVTSAASPPRVERRGSVQQAPTLAPVTTTGASYGRRDAAGAGAGFHGRGEQKHKRVVIGVCGMDKKVNAPPMQNILKRMPSKRFKIVIFGNDVILTKPAAEWPECDCLLAFYSSGFPLEKAEEYVKRVKPFCVNDLASEHVLRDRRLFYSLLRKNGLKVPKHVFVNRDRDPPPVVIEHDEYVEVNGKRIRKPLVEKPVDAEDHNIYIYYPSRLGGGHKRLFRKKKNKASEFVPGPCSVRTTGSYIYEEFILTQGTDIKIYAVGAEYHHAEARKSPVVDGVVVRDNRGKEVRFPVVLNSYEKEMAHKVVKAFGMNVCGFDLLRTHKTSYICDVNGWSFVKTSHKYYDDCAAVITRLILAKLDPAGLRSYVPSRPRLTPLVRRKLPNSTNQGEELRGVIAIIRHGDRTPKQKMKMKITNKRLCSLVNKHGSDPLQDVVLKQPDQMTEVLDITRALIAEAQERAAAAAAGDGDTHSDDGEEDLEKLLQLRDVLETGGRFLGINRKVQIKPKRWAVRPVSPTRGPPKDAHHASPELSSLGLAQGTSPMQLFKPLTPSHGAQAEAVAAAAAAAAASKANAAEQSKKRNTELVVTEAQLVLKWGGVLTPAGRRQAEELGKRFRSSMYPGESWGLLRLHSTYRHDLKIYSSDEGRVQMTAAAFVKGLLSLEGELTPILASLVRYQHAKKLLDDLGLGRERMHAVKQRLHAALASARTDKGAKAAPTAAPAPPAPTAAPAPAPAPASGTSTASVGDASAASTAGDGRTPPSSVTATAAAAVAASGDAHGALSAFTNHVAGRRSSVASSHSQPSDLGDSDGAPASSSVSPALARRGIVRSGSNTSISSLASAGPPTGPLYEETVNHLSSMIDPDLLREVAPTRQLSLLRALVAIGPHPRAALRRVWELIKVLTADLRSRIEANAKAIAEGKQPSPTMGCGAVPLPIMLGRWQKLEHELYKEKKDKFDLSKIPDIYDCIKYDVLHNGFLDSPHVRELYRLAQAFADIVIPQEYGITAEDKHIISKHVSRHLFRKLYFDLTSVRGDGGDAAELRARPLHTAYSALQHELQAAGGGGDNGLGATASTDGGMAAPAAPAERPRSVSPRPAVSPTPKAPPRSATLQRNESEGAVPDAESVSSKGSAPEGAARSAHKPRRRARFKETVHSLDASVHSDGGYTQIKSPTRHVRTRLYFTSESHVHSVVNGLRCWGYDQNVLSKSSEQRLSTTPQLDYLTHIVFRLYENFRMPPDHPRRYRVEILFSPGCAFSPFNTDVRKPLGHPLGVAHGAPASAAAGSSAAAASSGSSVGGSSAGSNTASPVGGVSASAHAAAAAPHPRSSNMPPRAAVATQAVPQGAIHSPDDALRSRDPYSTRDACPDVVGGLSHVLPPVQLIPLRTSLTLDEVEEALRVTELTEDSDIEEEEDEEDNEEEDDAHDGTHHHHHHHHHHRGHSAGAGAGVGAGAGASAGTATTAADAKALAAKFEAAAAAAGVAIAK